MAKRIDRESEAYLLAPSWHLTLTEPLRRQASGDWIRQASHQHACYNTRTVHHVEHHRGRTCNFRVTSRALGHSGGDTRNLIRMGTIMMSSALPAVGYPPLSKRPKSRRGTPWDARVVLSCPPKGAMAAQNPMTVLQINDGGTLLPDVRIHRPVLHSKCQDNTIRCFNLLRYTEMGPKKNNYCRCYDLIS